MTGDELRQWREERQLTQTELSEKLGVKFNTVSRWEVGTRAVPSFLELALETIGRRLNGKKGKSKK
jgi:transcriptional regulator with XRE-family HTH domain